MHRPTREAGEEEKGKGKRWGFAVCMVCWWSIYKIRYKNEGANKKACNARLQRHYGYVADYPCRAIRAMTARTHHHISVSIML